ncbi:beta-ketoacyl-ACP synthase III [Clostridium gasigenes]|uniref:beta-ketoacyl-ACP synthase III n=1 Tax=Clostridium gasigenes TaxID=94869 RepID=UPI001C0B5B97|nr:beta-ketoacyl-ACP synthase III [Clostridium gasigenes]MBU3104157.1 ketoacyl-ACP synthase III [Clostridium gasigenes]MBU3132551.1 ketoacyl-ACP synthase III [Clostridium gasigenes]
MKEVVISGIGAYAPSNIVTNEDLSAIVDTSDEWILDRTGIKERRISTGEDTSNIATKAAILAIERSGVQKEDLELIIVATITPDMCTPSVACMVQKELGAKGATAFDINAACSGFIYAIQIAESMMKIHGFKNALIIGAETLSKIIDWKDRGTCVLFGDGGGAVVLTESNTKGIINTFSKSDGSKYESLVAGAFDVENPYALNVVKRNNKVQMKGGEVFKFATAAIVEAVKEVLLNTDCNLEDVKYIVPHQANLRIIDYAAKKLNVDKEKFYVNLDRFGNTSSASIPIALNEMYEKGMLKAKDKIVLVGFGGGLTFGSVLIEWK